MKADTKALAEARQLFAGPGENAAILRAFDWSSHPLGPPETWPLVWRIAMRLMLDSAHAACVMIGPDFYYFHNDAYRPITGSKHPGCVGSAIRDVWPTLYDGQVGPMIVEVTSRGRPILREHNRYELEIDGALEERYFTFTYNPLHDVDGTVVGIFNVCFETTIPQLTRRRLDCLRLLSSHAFVADTPGDACKAAGDVIATAAVDDCPAALLYLVDREKREACLMAAPGISTAHCAQLPQRVSVCPDDFTADDLRIAEVVQTRQVLSAPAFAARIDATGANALALPILEPGGDGVAGVLLGLATVLRPLDEVRDYLQLLASQLSTVIANARAKEHATERTKALAALDRAKTTFFSNVSHELRTPLTLLIGPLTQVLAAGKLTGDDRELLELARRGAARLQKLIKSLLDFSRIEVGRVDAHYEPVDLAAYTKDLASMFASAFEAAAIAFVVDVPPLSEAVYVDREMWEKIVLNLLSNALKFTMEGEVRVSLRAEQGTVRLSVADTGCGIAEEHLPQIFERFYRVQAPRARTQEGTGIGLSMVRELARLHGGMTWVESTVGRGTTVHVRIQLGTAHLPAGRLGPPRKEEAPGTFAHLFRDEAHGWLENAERTDDKPASYARTLPPTDTGDLARRTDGACILLAEDNADMRRYLRRILGEHWGVRAVADGTSALELARSIRPNLIVADVMMPGLDGFGLLAAVRADPAMEHVPVLLVSARAAEQATAQALGAGAADYIVKPFSPRELVARVQAQLAQAHLQTTERAARRLAEDASRARERFLAMLAHELRTPLNAVLGWSELLRSGQLTDCKAERGLRVIEQSGQMLQRLVEDLLDVSRVRYRMAFSNSRGWCSVSPRADPPGSVAQRVRQAEHESGTCTTVPSTPQCRREARASRGMG